VLLLLLRGLDEEGRDLLEAGFFRRSGEVGVAIAGLGLAGEGGKQVFLGLGAFQGF